MKIKKITFANEQAWIVIESEDGEYIGTWHCIHPKFVELLRKEMPEGIEFKI